MKSLIISATLFVSMTYTPLANAREDVRIIAKPISQKQSPTAAQNVKIKNNTIVIRSSVEQVDSVIVEMRNSGLYENVAIDYVVNSGFSSPKTKSGANVFQQSVFNDPFYASQVYFNDPEVHAAGIGIESAQALVVPYRAMQVGIVDGGFMNGITDFDLSDGYSFIEIDGNYVGNSFLVDPAAEDLCETGHGTGVASVIGAIKNNGIGIAGIADVDIVAAQALQCGSGFLTYVSNSILWLAGEDVANAPTREVAVDVINLSLGGIVPECPFYLQDAINVATDKGTVVVASAGNDYTQAIKSAPANCENVIVVGALDYNPSQPELGSKDKASFSNFGDALTISTQGVDVVGAGIDDLTQYYWEGTSFSAPMVAGTVAMIKQVLPNATREVVVDILSITASSFSTDSICSVKGCGVGAMNNLAAVSLARNIADMGVYATLTPVLSKGEHCNEEAYVLGNGALARLCEMFIFTPFLDNEDGVTYSLFQIPKGVVTTSSTTLGANATEIASGFEYKSRIPGLTNDADYFFTRCKNNECSSVAYKTNLDISGNPAACIGL